MVELVVDQSIMLNGHDGAGVLYERSLSGSLNKLSKQKIPMTAF